MDQVKIFRIFPQKNSDRTIFCVALPRMINRETEGFGIRLLAIADDLIIVAIMRLKVSCRLSGLTNALSGNPEVGYRLAGLCFSVTININRRG